jgi:tetratricopeptide (TPR) repeat protein
VLEPDCAPELLEIASASIPVLESYGDDRALGRAWLSVGHIRGGFYCQYAAWKDAASRAATHYRRSGWSPSNALDHLGVALYFGPTPVSDGMAQCETLLREYEGDRASEANILVWMGGLEGLRGNFEAARALVSRARGNYEELGLTMAATDTCGRVLGSIEMNAGCPEKAEEALRQACELLEQMHQTAVLATRAAQLADAVYAQGRIDQAEFWTRVARTSAGEEDLDAKLCWQPVQAKLFASNGALEEAERLARETLVLVSGTDALGRHADSLLVLAEILRLSARLDEADKLTNESLRLYEVKGSVVAAERTRALLFGAAVAE